MKIPFIPRFPLLLSLAVVSLFVVAPTHVAHADIGSAVLNVLYEFVVTVFGIFLGLSAVILNYALNEFVINFGFNFENGGWGYAINNLWIIIRDIFNLTFIFGLVYIGFKMILNSNDSQAKRWLANLIIAALLVNFSLFFTKFFVDITNFIATEILDAGVSVNLIRTDPPVPGNTNERIDLSESVVNIMDFTTIFGGTPDEPFTGSYTRSQQEGNNVGLGLIFGTMLMFLVAIFVFFSTGILFLIRTITLMLYMVFSPFLFIGMVFPGLQSEASKHVKRFISQALFAPVYAVLLYVSLALMSSLTTGPLNYAGELQGNAVGASMGSSFGTFILVCGLLIASLSIGKQLGVAGASSALKVGTSMRRGIQRQTARGAGGIGARAINRTGERLQRSLDRRGIKSDLLYSATGSMQKAKVAGSETASQMRDRRNKRQTQQNDAQRATKREAQNREALGWINDPSLRAAEQRAKAEAKAADATASEAERAAAQRQLDENRFEADARREGANVLARNNRDASNDEVMDMVEAIQADVNKGEMSPEQLDAFLASLTATQMQALEKSGRFTAQQLDGTEDDGKDGYYNRRTDASFKDVFTELENTSNNAQILGDELDNLSRIIKKMSGDQKAELGIDKLTDERIAYNLSDSDLDTLQNTRTPEEMRLIRAARTSAFKSVAETGSLKGVTPPKDAAEAAKHKTNMRRKMVGKNVQDAGKLPIDVFKSPEMVEHITPQMLEERLKNGFNETDINGGDGKVGIREVIDTHIRGLSPTEQNRQKKIWKQWSDKSSWGSVLDLESIHEESSDSGGASSSASFPGAAYHKAKFGK